MEAKVLKRLEEMAENPEGILSICIDGNCGKIKAIPNDINLNPRDEDNPEGLSDVEIMEISKRYWVKMEDVPELYERVVALYSQKEKEHSGAGVSGSYCPDHFDPLLR